MTFNPIGSGNPARGHFNAASNRHVGESKDKGKVSGTPENAGKTEEPSKTVTVDSLENIRNPHTQKAMSGLRDIASRFMERLNERAASMPGHKPKAGEPAAPEPETATEPAKADEEEVAATPESAAQTPAPTATGATTTTSSAFSFSYSSSSAGGASSASSTTNAGENDLLNNLGFDMIAKLEEAFGISGLGQGGQLSGLATNFSINLSIAQSISTANGASSTTLSMSLSLSLSWSTLGTTGVGDSGASTASPFGLNVDSLLGAMGFGTNATDQTSSAGSAFDALTDYYSPEKTADRILGMAMSFYPGSKFAAGGDSEENRQAFADYIGAAIQKGFDQAAGIYGKIDKKTQDGVDTIHSRVFNGLDEFVKNGQKKSEETQNMIDNVLSWQSSVQVSYSRATYNAQGQSVTAQYYSQSISASFNAQA